MEQLKNSGEIVLALVCYILILTQNIQEIT